ncbi:MAG: hypothetical protein FWD23_00375 [Oscillospiraceae bacterium]|nr:hypothetical protein [Oscillospiraceae bacterium]
MKKFDLLFTEENKETKANTSGRIFIDLCFDKIKDAVFSEKPWLYDRFCEVLSHMANSAETVAARRRIFEDFCEYPGLLDSFAALCEQSAEYKNKVFHHEKFRNHFEQTLAQIETYNKFADLLSRRTFKSEILAKPDIKRCDELADELKKAYRVTEKNGLRLQVRFSPGFKLKSARLAYTEPVKIEVRKIRKEIFLYDENYFIFSGKSMSQFVFEEDIYKGCQNSVSAIMSQISHNIRQFFIKLKQCVEFYQAALAVKQYLRQNNLPFCMPDVTEDGGVDAAGLYDLSLAVYQESGQNSVTNDFSFNDGNIIVVTGLNQGGKTTFLRSVGIAQLFAQAGLFVPAARYRCRCFCGILTHFPAEEDNNLDYGKLAEELTRLSGDFPVILDGGLALFNESFASTTAREGAEISRDVLRALSKTGSCAVFVTHLYEFATKLDDLNRQLFNNSKAVSMVTEFKDKNTRTYKIIKGAPLDDIYASDHVF